MEHLTRNGLICHIHHGLVCIKSTQTLITEIYDQLLENLNTGEETALILLDQSKVYDLINHPILISKLKALGISMYIYRGADSDKLTIGPQSVSCILYLVYVLDLQMVFHDKRTSTRRTEKMYQDKQQNVCGRLFSNSNNR